MGTCDADIYAIEIIERTPEVIVGDFILRLPSQVMPDSLISACETVPEVNVVWLSNYPENWGLESDIELLTRMSDDPDRAGEILTAASPSVFRCQWAFLTDGNVALASTSLAPDVTATLLAHFGDLDKPHTVDLASDFLPDWSEATCLVQPLGKGRTLVVGRQGGPVWLSSEVTRLRYLGGMAP